MTVPVFDNFTEAKVANAAAITITKPTNIVEDDLMVAVIATAGRVDDITLAGWTVIQESSGSSTSIATLYKVAGGSEPADYTFTWARTENAYGFIMRITGHDTTAPINISGLGDGTSATPTCPTVNTTVDDCLVLRIFGADEDDITVDGGYPSGTTGITVDSSGSLCSGGAAYESQVTTGATGTAAFSLTASQEWIGVSVAIPPSSAVSSSISSSPSASISASISVSPSASISSSPSASISATPSASISASISVSPSSSISSSPSGTASASPSSSISSSPSSSISASISSSPSISASPSSSISASPSRTPSASISSSPSSSISSSPSASASRTPSASPSTSISSSPSSSISASISSSPSSSISASPSGTASASPSSSPSASASVTPSASVSSSPSATPTGSPSASPSASASSSPDDVDTTGFTAYESAGTSQHVENTFVNLDHLEGETVKILGTDVDDVTSKYDDETVTSGIITLMELSPHAHNFVRKATVGLPFRYTLSPMRLDITTAGGTSHGSIAKIHKIIGSFLNTLGAKAGSTLDDLKDIDFDSSTSLNTGDFEIPFDGGYGIDDTIYISGDEPFPCTVRAIIPRKDVTGQ